MIDWVRFGLLTYLIKNWNGLNLFSMPWKRMSEIELSSCSG